MNHTGAFAHATNCYDTTDFALLTADFKGYGDLFDFSVGGHNALCRELTSVIGKRAYKLGYAVFNRRNIKGLTYNSRRGYNYILGGDIKLFAQ